MAFDFQIDPVRFPRLFLPGSEESCRQAVATLFDALPAVESLLLTTLDGHRVASAIAAGREANPQRLAAIVGSLCGLGETLVRESGHRDFRDVTIVAESGLSVVRRLPEPGQRLIVLATAGSGTNPGLVGSHARHVAQQLARYCSVQTT